MRSRLVFSLLALALLSCAGRTTLRPFSSDGCSLFPDGPRGDRRLWCDCCFAHDIAYWRGGTEAERKEADRALHDCVLEKSGAPLVSDMMFYGTRLGGSPVFPTGFRWGYGWSYGRGFEPLTEAEAAEARERLAAYRREHPLGDCAAK